MIVKDQAMFLIGAQEHYECKCGRPKVWHKKYILPHSAGPYSVPRFGPGPTYQLLPEVDWKFGPDGGLNAAFIGALVQSVQQVNVSVLCSHFGLCV